MDADRLARLELFLDRQDIIDCLTRFSRGMDRFDRDLFLSAFHPDAVIAAGDFVGGPTACMTGPPPCTSRDRWRLTTIC